MNNMLLSREKWVKVGKGAFLAAIGAVLTYLIDALPGFDIPPQYLPLIAGALSAIANYVRKVVW